jgi:serine/threonine protein kinase
MSPASRYTILRKIADGGTAEIFLAKQHGAQGFEKAVVLKRIFTTFYADPQFRHMLVDEAHVAMTLNHSNIVQVLDLGEAEGRYFLALELVDGWTLDRILRRSKAAGVPFPPALALYLTAEVCRALAYAHGKNRPDGQHLGIVHRDISPHNVLVSEQGEVKITDFGIAKAQTRREQSPGNLIKGKIAFMSPEQASGEPLDARSDLFSVGTMLYAMVTRRHPFDAPTDYETLMLVKNGDFVPPETARPGLNPELYRVIRKAMSRTPGERYQKADEMLVDVEQVMRVAFRPVGQTELQRWLAELSAKDGVPPLTREAPPPEAASQSTVGPLRADQDQQAKQTKQDQDKENKDEGQESGLVLNLEDAVEMKPSSGRRPPPMPAPTEAMKHPPKFVNRDRPWHQRREVRIVGAVALLLLFGIAVRATTGRHTPPAATPPAAEAPPPAPPPPVPAPVAPTVSPPPTPPAAEPPKPRASEPSNPATGSAPAPVVAAAEPPAPADKPPGAPAAGLAKVGDETAPAEAPEPETEKTDKAAKTKRTPVPITLKSDPEGSHVATGHHGFGTTPLTLKLRPGNSYEFTFTKAGYAPLTRRYHLDGAEPQILRVTLKKAPPPPKPAAPAPAAKPAPPPPKPVKQGWFGR